MFTQPDYSQFSKKFPGEKQSSSFLPPPLSLSPSPSWPLAYCLFTGQPASAPINKASRRMGGETLQAFNFARNVYVKERRGAEPQESDPSFFLPLFLSSFLSLLSLLPIHHATDPIQPSPVQVVTGVFNKVNFKTPARTEINFNAGYRLSPARSGFLPALAT